MYVDMLFSFLYILYINVCRYAVLLPLYHFRWCASMLLINKMKEIKIKENK